MRSVGLNDLVFVLVEDWDGEDSARGVCWGSGFQSWTWGDKAVTLTWVGAPGVWLKLFGERPPPRPMDEEEGKGDRDFVGKAELILAAREMGTDVKLVNLASLRHTSGPVRFLGCFRSLALSF